MQSTDYSQINFTISVLLEHIYFEQNERLVSFLMGTLPLIIMSHYNEKMLCFAKFMWPYISDNRQACSVERFKLLKGSY